MTIRKQRGQPPGISFRHLHWLDVVLKSFAALQRRLWGQSRPPENRRCSYRNDEMPFSLAGRFSSLPKSNRLEREVKWLGFRMILHSR